MMDITLLNLEYFLAVAEELNITKAADRLFISPQSLSKHIQRLEEYFDSKLFVRSSPMRLTRAGETLEAGARQLLESKERICSDVRAAGREESAAIQLGMIYDRSSYLFSGILAGFAEKYPDINTIVYNTKSENIAQQIYAGKIDMGVLIMGPELEMQFPDLEVVQLYSDTMYICATDEALKKYCVEPVHDVIARADNEGPGFLLEYCPTTFIKSRQMPDMSRLSNITSDSFSLTAALCLQGIGVTFCTRSQLPVIYAMSSAFENVRLHHWQI